MNCMLFDSVTDKHTALALCLDIRKTPSFVYYNKYKATV